MGMVWVLATASDEQVATLRADPSGLYDFVNSEEAYESGRSLELDKQWHAVHFLLTGSAGATDDPLSLIIGTFEEIGPDNGYGPAWFVPKRFIGEFDRTLSAQSNAEIAARYDAAAMVREDVYIADALEEEGEEGLQFLMEDIDRLRTFVTRAAAEGANAFGLIT
ncbi:MULTISPECIES: YfbM family protein [Sphingomonas]|uniref:YfbM family protein n=1 Tax=Sphingomonas TaxID=13687 RepID=UPI00082F8E27|nr:YfbM family protein [Sphingomonas sp. CCH10-B3]